MGGIGNEPALSAGRCLQPVQHRVHRLGQAVHLVAPCRQGHPLGQVTAADHGDPAAYPLDRRQRATHAQPGDQRGQQQCRRQDFDEQPARALDRPVGWGQRQRHHDRAPRRPGSSRLLQDPEALTTTDRQLGHRADLGPLPARVRLHKRALALNVGAGGQDPAAAVEHLDQAVVVLGRRQDRR